MTFGETGGRLSFGSAAGDKAYWAPGTATLCCERASITATIQTIEGDVLLSPNPVNDELHIQLSLNKASILSMNVFDLSGKIISSQPFSLSEGKNEVMLETDHLYPGFYMLIITDGNTTQSYKFVK